MNDFNVHYDPTLMKNDCLQWVQNIAKFEDIHIEYIEAARTTFLEALRNMDGSNELCVDELMFVLIKSRNAVQESYNNLVKILAKYGVSMEDTQHD